MRRSIDQSAGGAVVELRIGDELEVRLGENPTTGYRWRIDLSEVPELELLSSTFVPAPGAGVGGGGTRTVLLRAVREGEARVSWVRARGGASGGDRFGISVVVRG